MKFKIFRYFIAVSILFITGTSSLRAQTVIISTDPLDDTGMDYALVQGADDEGVFVVHSNLPLGSDRDRVGLRNRKYQLSFYNYGMKRRWTIPLVAGYDGASIEGVTFFNNKLVVLSTIIDKTQNKYKLFIDVYNNKGKAEITGKNATSFSYTKSNALEKPRLIISPGKNNLGIYVNETGDGTQTMNVALLDTNYKALISHSGKVNYGDRDLLVTDYSIADNGEFYLLGMIKDPDPAKEKKKQRIYTLLVMKAGSEEVKEYKINDSSRPMTEAAITVDKIKGNAVVTGFYADKQSFSGAGLIFAKLKTGSDGPLEIKNYPVGGDAQIKLVGERNSGGGISLFSYPIQKVVLRNDGGAVIIAEAAYLSEYSYYDYFTQSYSRRIEYHFDNIVAFSVNNEGVIQWSQMIRKEQTSLDDFGLYSSFDSYLNSDELGIVYNKDIGRNNEIAAVVINKSGQQTTKRVTKLGDNITILPRAGKQIDESAIVIPAISKKRLHLIQIEL